MPPICGRYPPFSPSIAQRFSTCSRQNLEAFFADRAESGLAANSAVRKLSCLKRFTQFLVAEGLRADDPARLIDGAKARRKLPATLSIAEVDLLLTAAHEATESSTPGAGRRALRLACLLELLYGTGLRVSELVSLPRSALRGDRMMLPVKGKGGRERILPLNQKARECLDKWLEATRRTESAAEFKMAFSVLERRRPPDTAEIRARSQGARSADRHR